MDNASSAKLPAPPLSAEPRGTDGPGTGAFRRQMDEVVARIPMHAMRSVLDAVEEASSPGSERARHLREALVDHFNRLRPMKARRLFTGLFEPFLLDDPVLYRAPEAVPALVQRVDIGGLWAALTRYAFPGLAAEVQCRLDELSRDAMLDAVLGGPEALALRRSMRDAALDYLTRLNALRGETDRFLAAANEEALHDARLRTQYLTRKAPIGTDWLGFVRALLEHNDVLVPLAERMRRDIDEVRHRAESAPVEVDGQSALMVGFVRQVRDLGLPFRDQTQLLAWFAPLYALNNKRRYDVFLRHIREHGGPAVRESHPLLRALIGHFTAACATIRDVVDGMFDDVDVVNGGVLAIGEPSRTLLDAAVDRFDRSLAAVTGTGLLASRSLGPVIRSQLAELSLRLTGTILPALAARLQAAMAARQAPATDHGDVEWLLSMVCRWGRSLNNAGYASTELKSLRLFSVEWGRLAFVQAMKAEDHDRPSQRMAHLLRIRRLMAILGENVDAWISPVSQGLHRVVLVYLDQMEAIGEEEWAVICAYVTSVRRELARSRNWQSSDLVTILQLYERRKR